MKDLRGFLKKIPAEFDEYDIMNGEVGNFEAEDGRQLVYRADKPIVAMYVDEDSKEIIFFHQTQEDIAHFKDNTDEFA
jgi:hypothetical protein